MDNQRLVQHRSKEEDKEAILSLNLLERANVPKEKTLKCIYAVSNHIEEHYREVFIPKKKGGRRKLLVPDYLLHTMQKNILRIILSEEKVSKYAKAYCPGRRIRDNAFAHVGAETILELDIKDFFENITYIMVYQCVFSGEYYPPAVRTLLTQLCCYRDYLPQGAPTSPMISNLVMFSFDQYMGKWCEEREICYTRYCDDMTFSGKFDVREVKQKVRSYLQVLGFELNLKKTKVLKQYNRQSVTGIVVNEKAQVSKTYRRDVRQAVYYCGKYGVQEHLQRTGAQMWLQKGEERYLQHLMGKVNYILQVNPEDCTFQEVRKNLLRIQRQCKGGKP